jgi:hypothetical protein
MKEFKSLQQLLSYCLYCPICKDISRKVSVSVGPETEIRLVSDRKIDKILHLNIEAVGLQGDVTYKILIDCCLNTVKTHKTGIDISSEKYDPDISYVDNMYMYFFGACPICMSCINTNEISLNLLDGTVDSKSLGLENEMFHIGDGNEEYTVTNNFYAKHMEIIKVAPETDNEVARNNKAVTCPIFEINFNNLDKTMKRLKTIIVFS